MRERGDEFILKGLLCSCVRKLAKPAARNWRSKIAKTGQIVRFFCCFLRFFPGFIDFKPLKPDFPVIAIIIAITVKNRTFLSWKKLQKIVITAETTNDLQGPTFQPLIQVFARTICSCFGNGEARQVGIKLRAWRRLELVLE